MSAHSKLLERVAKAIHEAKLKECWGWMGRTKREPWEKPNVASPSQPWHDVAYAQAKAALDASHAEELKAMLENLLACQILDETGRHKGWRVSAGSDHGGGLTQRAEAARALLAKLDGQP